MLAIFILGIAEIDKGYVPCCVLRFDIIGRFTSGMGNCHSCTCCNRTELISSWARDVACRYVTGNGIGHVHRTDYDDGVQGMENQ